MNRNFNELLSKMKPEAQERVKARSSELLKDIALADRTSSSDDENATSSDEAGPERVRVNRKVALQISK
jgi:hypothetical protein